MATLSNNDIVRAIYLVSKDKTGVELQETDKKVVKFLARRRLLSKSKEILKQLSKIINYENERIVAKVLSVKKLKEESKKELTLFLKKHYKAKEVVLMEMLE